MPWFTVQLSVDDDQVRHYAVLADSEIEACFRARDWFDDLVHVTSEPYEAAPDDEFLGFDAVLGD